MRKINTLKRLYIVKKRLGKPYLKDCTLQKLYINKIVLNNTWTENSETFIKEYNQKNLLKRLYIGMNLNLEDCTWKTLLEKFYLKHFNRKNVEKKRYCQTVSEKNILKKRY